MSKIHARGCLIGRLLLGAVALVTLSTAGARAEYRINAGDVLELWVAGSPELRQRSAVNVDGEISFPLLGRLKVIGRPLSEVRAQIEEIIPTKVHRTRSSDGRENVYVISRDEVQVNIAEYRPIYLDGDVSKPGE